MKKNIVISIIILSFNTLIYAGGTETKPYSSAKSISLNGLYFAGGDGIIKSLLNPAGLIYQDKFSAEFSVSDFLAQNSFNSSTQGVFNSLREDDLGFSGGIFLPISKNINTALVYQKAVDYKVSWPFAKYFESGSTNSLLVFDFYNNLSIDALSFSTAYRMGNYIIGISPVLYRISNKISFPQNNSAWDSGNGSAGYQFEYTQKAWAFGFSLGVIAELSDKVDLGLSIRSGYSADLEGEANSKMFAVTDSADESTSLKSSFNMPWIVGFGAIYSLSNNMWLNFDIQYSFWTKSNTSFQFGSNIWQNNLTMVDPVSGVKGESINLSYKKALDIGLGFEYMSGGEISYRLGYRFTQSPNSKSVYNLLYPAVDQHVFTVGIGLKEGNIQFDGVLLYSIGIKKNITNQSVEILNGEYDYDLFMPMITLKYLIL